MQALIYNGPEDWVVHINNKRITPAAFPEEICEMNVTEDYVEMRWYDAYLRQIIPIRMRPTNALTLIALCLCPVTARRPHILERKKIMADVVTLENVDIAYGQHKAVRAASFAIKAGEMYGLVGLNGAGKTSFNKGHIRVARCR